MGVKYNPEREKTAMISLAIFTGFSLGIIFFVFVIIP